MGRAYTFVWFNIVFRFKYVEARGGEGMEDTYLMLFHSRTSKVPNLSWSTKYQQDLNFRPFRSRVRNPNCLQRSSSTCARWGCRGTGTERPLGSGTAAQEPQPTVAIEKQSQCCWIDFLKIQRERFISTNWLTQLQGLVSPKFRGQARNSGHSSRYRLESEFSRATSAC